MKTYCNLTLVLALSGLVLSAGAAWTATATATVTVAADEVTRLDADFNRLLGTYVHKHLVDYEAWSANQDDAKALGRYVDKLSALDPADWPRNAALAYWINLYNAVTLRLILDNYPLDSIKDIGGFLKKSPWKRELVTVNGRKLTLNNIENDIIRPDFGDARIHFALNCASIGCPPLSDEVFAAERLSEQLDAACRVALNRDQWVQVDGEKLKLTKIFDWYGDDFEKGGGSVLEFIRRYRTEAMPEGEVEIDFMSYDWSLNIVSK